MQTEPVVTYRNVDPSPSVDALVARRVEALERINNRIVGCETVIEAPQKRKVTGREYRVRLTLSVPGPDITVTRTSAKGSAREDLALALNRAFSAAEKLLKRQKKTMAAIKVKHHPPVLHGCISLLEKELGYGYIRADDGREVYFQQDALTADVWDQLAKGTRLRFRAMEGEKGPYATAVSLAGAG
ncbi:HPF/RaiA family ribosome-associated protein [Leisingera aquaemixtae]|uniref:HPF/RaiA family ribosome-associated protein n=1 Tax=Leisingera aquaemixtae TaxID=1396826 RepID=UPI001C95CA3C|nr:HPF/RaiA family ribosome-associated protein [Leisingera aquaemixtae]MBY6069435.1 HPF/RaiA family ribosome-associated protein [Leisingera aquaemixtae]